MHCYTEMHHWRFYIMYVKDLLYTHYLFLYMLSNKIALCQNKEAMKAKSSR